MAVSFVAAGTTGAGTGAVTPGMPTGATTDDLILLHIEGEGEDGTTDASPTGGAWTLVGTVASATDGAVDRTRHTVYWAWYDAGLNRTVPDAGNHTLAVLTAWRGVDLTTPFDVASVSSSSATNDTGVSVTGLTTVTDGAMIVASSSAGDDVTYASWANASLASITEAVDITTTSGSDGSIHVAYGIKTTLGTVSATTATASATEEEANWCIALRPDASQDITPAAVTITATGTVTITTGSVGITPAATTVTAAAGTVEVTFPPAYPTKLGSVASDEGAIVSTLDVTHVLSSGSNRRVFIFIAIDDGGGNPVPSTVTYDQGGTPLTASVVTDGTTTAAAVGDSGSQTRQEIWEVDESQLASRGGGSSYTVRVVTDSACDNIIVAVQAYQNADQSANVDAVAIQSWATSITDPAALSITTGFANCTVIDGITGSAGSLSATTETSGQIEFLDFGGAGSTMSLSDNPRVSSGATSMNWLFPSSHSRAAQVAFSLQANDGSLAITPAAVSVTAAAGSMVVTTGSVAITPTATTVTAAAGGVTVTTSTPIAPTGASVSVAAGTATITTGSVPITPEAVTVTVAAGTSQLDITVLLGGWPGYGDAYANTSAIISVSAGSMVATQVTPITLTGASVSAAAGSMVITTGSVPITPTGPTVSVAAGTVVVDQSLALTGATVTVTPAATTLDMSIALTGAAASAAAGSMVITQPAGGLPIDPAGATVSVAAGTVSLSIGVIPSAVTVTAAAGTTVITTTYPVTLTGPTVTVTPATTVVTTTYPITLTGATVTANTDPVVITTGSVDITPDPVTVNAAAGTVDVDYGLQPAAATVTTTAGTAQLDMSLAPAGATVSVAAGTTVLTYTYPIALTGPTVTAAGTVSIAPPNAPLTLTGATVTITPNTVVVTAGQPLTPGVLNITVAAGGMVATTTYPVALTGETVNVSAGSLDTHVAGVIPGIGTYTGLSAYEALHQRILFDGNTPPSPSEAPELVRTVTGGAVRGELLGVLEDAGATEGGDVDALLGLTNQTGHTELEEALIRFAESYGW